MPRIHDPQEILDTGKRLRRVRLSQKITLVELSYRLDCTYQQVQKYETGQNELSVSALKRMAAALGVKPCEICGCCNE